MTDFVFQASYKTPAGDLINIRADNAEDFATNLEDFLNLTDSLAAASSKLNDSFGVVKGGVATAVNVLGASVQSVAPVGGAVTVTQPGGAQGQGTPGQVYSDKWGRQFEYGLPQAPATPRGPAVKLTATKKDGSGTYSKWVDPAKGPQWFEQRLPKPGDHELFTEQWVR